MVGEDADHDGASKTFRFEVIEEHDPDRMKRKEPKDPEDDEDKYHDDDSEEDTKVREDEEMEDMAMVDEDEDDKEKHFLTTIEREFLALFTNEEK